MDSVEVQVRRRLELSPPAQTLPSAPRLRPPSSKSRIHVHIARGWHGPKTTYVRTTKRRWHIHWELDEAAIAYDVKSDGMYPLLTNDPSLTPRQVLEAHKRQPTIETCLRQAETVHEVALLVQALIVYRVRKSGHEAGTTEENR